MRPQIHHFNFQIEIKKIYSCRASIGCSARIICRRGSVAVKSISIATLVGKMENPTSLKLARAIARRFGIASQVRFVVEAGHSIPTSLEFGFELGEAFAAKFGGRCAITGLTYRAGDMISRYGSGYAYAI